MVELEVKEQKNIQKGTHTGVITKIVYKDEPYSYTDVVITETVSKIELKTGFPTTVSKTSGLGKLLERFGAKLVVGASLDPEKILLNKECSFVTTIEKTEQGEFSRILKDTIECK